MEFNEVKVDISDMQVKVEPCVVIDVKLEPNNGSMKVEPSQVGIF